MSTLGCIIVGMSAALLVGCSSFHQTQIVKFVDDDGRVVDVVYGYGDEDHVTKWVSPVNGKTIELKSKLRVKVKMEDGPSFKAFQCMNTLGSGTMYKTDNDRWMVLANGFSCTIYRQTEEDETKYAEVFRGVLCQTPEKEDKRK